jgi:hypothetical protein
MFQIVYLLRRYYFYPYYIGFFKAFLLKMRAILNGVVGEWPGPGGGSKHLHQTKILKRQVIA